MDNGIIKFECSPGLYQYLVSKGCQQSLKEDRKEDSTSNLISTVAENRQAYTLRQYEPRAKEARRLYHIFGSPIVNNFKWLFWMNAIQNRPVTVEDVDIFEKIFGPDISKSERQADETKAKASETESH
jgi:hypothetical protein